MSVNNLNWNIECLLRGWLVKVHEMVPWLTFSRKTLWDDSVQVVFLALAVYSTWHARPAESIFLASPLTFPLTPPTNYYTTTLSPTHISVLLLLRICGFFCEFGLHNWHYYYYYYYYCCCCCCCWSWTCEGLLAGGTTSGRVGLWKYLPTPGVTESEDQWQSQTPSSVAGPVLEVEVWLITHCYVDCFHFVLLCLDELSVIHIR